MQLDVSFDETWLYQYHLSSVPVYYKMQGRVT